MVRRRPHQNVRQDAMWREIYAHVIQVIIFICIVFLVWLKEFLQKINPFTKKQLIALGIAIVIVFIIWGLFKLWIYLITNRRHRSGGSRRDSRLLD